MPLSFGACVRPKARVNKVVTDGGHAVLPVGPGEGTSETMVAATDSAERFATLIQGLSPRALLLQNLLLLSSP
jgi:hypothetical protein